MSLRCTQETPWIKAWQGTVTHEDVREVHRYPGLQGTMVIVECPNCGQRFNHGPLSEPAEEPGTHR